MKRLFLSLAILATLSFSVSANAQDMKKGGRKGFPMEKELNLTDTQKKEMETLRADFGKKMKELRDNSALSKDDKQTKMKELRDGQKASVDKILTPEQLAKAKEIREKKGDAPKRGKNMTAHRGKAPHKHGKPMANRGDKMKDLNLTEDQKKQIKALNEEYKGKSKEMAQQRREALNKVYTPEQQEKIKEMRKDFGKDGRFAFKGKGKRGNDYPRLDEAGKTKMKELRENYMKEKKAVELSRIAPDAQKEKIKELRENYMKEKRQIIKESSKSNG